MAAYFERAAALPYWLVVDEYTSPIREGVFTHGDRFYDLDLAMRSVQQKLNHPRTISVKIIPKNKTVN
jgi:hypothetical protein